MRQRRRAANQSRRPGVYPGGPIVAGMTAQFLLIRSRRALAAAALVATLLALLMQAAPALA